EMTCSLRSDGTEGSSWPAFGPAFLVTEAGQPIVYAVAPPPAVPFDMRRMHMFRIRLCAFGSAAILLGLPGAALADTFTGTLNVVWGDPKDRSSSAGGIQYILATPDGRYVPMQVASGTNSVLPFNGRPGGVTGPLGSQAPVARTAGEH